jgi:opacity protein-like surface antigen
MAVSTRVIGALVLGIGLMAAPARADSFVAPWIGVDAGSRIGSSTIDAGVNVGSTIGQVIGVDFDLGYAPDYFGPNLDSHVLTAMGNVTVGIPFGGTSAPRFRPYVTAGVGLIRASIDVPRSNSSVASNDFGVNVGGGVMGFFASHIGVRADLRYVHSTNDDGGTTTPYGVIDLSRLHFWRTSFGLVLR